MKLTWRIIVAGAILIGITGCSTEPRTVTMHEPGAYKGTKDPLLDRQQQQELINRFKAVQTDR